jgi:hypothetical protein
MGLQAEHLRLQGLELRRGGRRDGLASGSRPGAAAVLALALPLPLALPLALTLPLTPTRRGSCADRWARWSLSRLQP